MKNSKSKSQRKFTPSISWVPNGQDHTVRFSDPKPSSDEELVAAGNKAALDCSGHHTSNAGREELPASSIQIYDSDAEGVTRWAPATSFIVSFVTQGCVVSFVNRMPSGLPASSIQIYWSKRSRRWTPLAPTAGVAGDHGGGGSAPPISRSVWRCWLWGGRPPAWLGVMSSVGGRRREAKGDMAAASDGDEVGAMEENGGAVGQRLLLYIR